MISVTEINNNSHSSVVCSIHTQYLNYRPNNEGCKGKLEIGVMAVADAEIQKRLMVKTHTSKIIQTMRNYK